MQVRGQHYIRDTMPTPPRNPISASMSSENPGFLLPLTISLGLEPSPSKQCLACTVPRWLGEDLPAIEERFRLLS